MTRRRPPKKMLRPPRARASAREATVLRDRARRMALAAIACTWLAWAAVGGLSGVMSVLVSPDGPHHYEGLAAVLLALAVLVAALAVGGAAAAPCPPVGEVPSRCHRLRQGLWRTAATAFVLAYAADVAEGTGNWFTAATYPGLASGRALVDALGRVAVAVDAPLQAVGVGFEALLQVTWFVVCLVVLAVVRWRKRPPAVTVRTLLLQWLPMFAWWSLHGVVSIATVPSSPDRTDLALRADASWALTSLVVMAGAWLQVGVGATWWMARARARATRPEPRR